MKYKHPSTKIAYMASIIVEILALMSKMKMVDLDEVNDSLTALELFVQIICFFIILITGIFLLSSALTKQNLMILFSIKSHHIG